MKFTRRLVCLIRHPDVRRAPISLSLSFPLLHFPLGLTWFPLLLCAPKQRCYMVRRSRTLDAGTPPRAPCKHSIVLQIIVFRAARAVHLICRGCVARWLGVPSRELGCVCVCADALEFPISLEWILVFALVFQFNLRAKSFWAECKLNAREREKEEISSAASAFCVLRSTPPWVAHAEQRWGQHSCPYAAFFFDAVCAFEESTCYILRRPIFSWLKIVPRAAKS